MEVYKERRVSGKQTEPAKGHVHVTIGGTADITTPPYGVSDLHVLFFGLPWPSCSLEVMPRQRKDAAQSAPLNSGTTVPGQLSIYIQRLHH
jgi:hypothetical protein